MSELSPPWHALFAPLPADVVPERKPVAARPPWWTWRFVKWLWSKVTGTDPLAGWENLTIHLSAGLSGMRIVLVTQDGQGRPLSASDMVYFRRERPGAPPDEAVEHVTDTVGGRLEPDGTFLGTRWHSVSVMAGDCEEPRRQENTPSAPTAADVAAIKVLVADMQRRALGNP